jgi:hypothetical protein
MSKKTHSHYRIHVNLTEQLQQVLKEIPLMRKNILVMVCNPLHSVEKKSKNIPEKVFKPEMSSGSASC